MERVRKLQSVMVQNNSGTSTFSVEQTTAHIFFPDLQLYLSIIFPYRTHDRAGIFAWQEVCLFDIVSDPVVLFGLITQV